eukprot:s1005_g40.t1
MARIFGDRGRLEPEKPRLHASSNSFVRLDVEVSEGLQCRTAVNVQPVEEDRTLYASVVKHVLGGSYIEEREAKRSHAVHQWWDLLRLDMRCSDPGWMALHEKGLADIFKNGVEILDASLGIKSPNTVMKRLYSVKTFNQCVIRNYSRHWLPVNEMLVWRYFKALKEEKAPATRANSFLEALRFCHFVFRVDGCEETPADPFHVADVVFLHKAMLEEARSKVDRIFIVHLLHMIYSRSRFSDLLAATRCVLDEEQMFFELSAAVHKGARSTEAKAMLLPVVAPAHGTRGGCWVSDCLALRKEMGLPLPEATPAPMLPAPGRSGLGWQKRYLTSQEMNAFIKKLFQSSGVRHADTNSFERACEGRVRCIPITPVPEVVKATEAAPNQLCEKRGSFVASQHHSFSSKPNSPKLRVLQVGTPPVPGTPDEKKMWPMGNLDDLEGGDKHVEPPDLLAEWEEQSSSSNSYSSSSSEDEGKWAEPVFAEGSAPRSSCARAQYFINGATLVIHELRSDGFFKCGRSVGSVYFPIHELTGLRCGKCSAGKL